MLVLWIVGGIIFSAIFLVWPITRGYQIAKARRESQEREIETWKRDPPDPGA